MGKRVLMITDKVKPFLRNALRMMHPMHMAMMPKTMKPEIDRSTLLFKTTRFNKQKNRRLKNKHENSGFPDTHEGSWS